MSGDAGWDVCEAGLRVDAVELGRDEQAVHGASTLVAAVRAGEGPRLASEGYAALGSIVRSRHEPIVEEARKDRPAREHVVHSFR